MKNRGIKKTFNETWSALGATIKSAFKLAPCLVLMLALVTVVVTVIAITSAKLMVGVVLLVVLGVAVLVYATTDKYGEAALALVAGLLTVYTVDWTPSRFVAFVAVWVSFCFLALLIASVKLAARSESLYRQASVALAENPDQGEEIESFLEQVGKDNSIEGLGPIERAETLLLFAYRKLPLDKLKPALRAVSLLTVITQIDHKVIGVFVADVYKIFDFVPGAQQDKVVDIVYETLRKSAVPPMDFIKAFEHSRRFVLSRSLGPTEFFAELQQALESGIAPEATSNYFAKRFDNND